MGRQLGGKNKETPEVTPEKLQEVVDSLPASSIDSDLGDNISAAFDTQDGDAAMNLHPKSVSDGRGMTPANYVERRPGEGFIDSRDIQTPPAMINTDEIVDTKRVAKVAEAHTSHSTRAKPATQTDLSNLDESMILNMPEIKAATFEVMDLLNPKPKDKTMRFRWVNYKNSVASNLAKYMALGYVTASKDDIEGDVHESMIEGNTVKYYDVILMKIPVLRLMSLYKANIVKSVNRLANARQRGIKEANRQFASDIQNSGALTQGYNRVKDMIGGKEPVEFYTPGMEDSQVVGS